ncbi:MAG: DJ-1/PfpI family protein [Candidatus Dependentiae bacterium]|nr:DJ-1/PfpI family protein [Candidatus Dependentiae bacterium]
MSNGKILFVVAHEGYHPIEYGVPKKILEDAGYTIVTASDKEGAATASDGTSTTVDLLIHKAQASNYDGIFFIGGPGALAHLDNETSYALIKSADHAKKVIGAICISTRILAKSNTLKGKQATGWNGDNELAFVYQEHDVRYVNQSVAVDETIITAANPDSAQEFGEQILTVLQTKKGWG